MEDGTGTCVHIYTQQNTHGLWTSLNETKLNQIEENKEKETYLKAEEKNQLKIVRLRIPCTCQEHVTKTVQVFISFIIYNIFLGHLMYVVLLLCAMQHQQRDAPQQNKN